MQRKTLVVLIGLSIIATALIVALLPPGVAAALPQATATVEPFGNFVIPTATQGSGGGFSIPTATQSSGGGFSIPTATPGSGGGFSIPTSTPGAPAGPSLPPLNDNDLTALNLQPGDVPASFGGSQKVESFQLSDMVDSIRKQGATSLADTVEQAGKTYGWDKSVGVTYTSCQPTVPVSEIYSEVGQMASPDAARAYFDDPNVQQIFTTLGYTVTPAQNVHGWRTVLPAKAGACFAQETQYGVFFEYWGLWINIAMTADANTDPNLVNGLLDQLMPVIIARADKLASGPFPATPVPGSGPVSVQVPSPTVPSIGVPTQPPAIPPTQSTGGATLTDIESAMPTLQEIGLPTPTFSLNSSLSMTQTLDQTVASIQGNFPTLANTMSQTGKRDGEVGTVIRVWDTGTACTTVALSVEVDVSLFQTAQGALANVNDSAIQQAWIATGIVSKFESQGSDAVLATGTLNYRCGSGSPLYNKLVAHGRFVVAVAVIGSPGADEKTILTAIDQLSAYTIQKLDSAGLQ